MATDDTATLQDLEEEQDRKDNPPVEEAHSIQPAAAPAIAATPEPAAPAIPTASGALPAAGFHRPEVFSVPAAEQPPAIAEPPSVARTPFPGDQPVAAINPRIPPAAPTGATVAGNAARQNPFTAIMSNEPAIHSPVARVLHKLSMMSPEIRQEEEKRNEFAAEQPYKQALTEDVQQQVAQRKAEAARMAGGQIPIEKPIPIYAAPGTPNAGEQVGEKGYDKYGQYHENMFPGAGPGPAPVAGPQTQHPGVAGGANSVPAGAQTIPAGAMGPTSGPPARTVTTMKPQEPQRPPLATPAEAAKLAPVGTEADRYNKEIGGVLGKEAGDYKVAPTDSAEKAEKTLADARARAAEIARNASNERAAKAPTEAQARKDASTMGYAAGPDGKVLYTNKADAAKNGMTFEEMKPDAVKADRQSIRQLNDVQQNVSRYRDAMDGIKENISPLDSSTMAAILSDKGLGAKVEPFGVGLDLGQLNDVITNTEKAGDWNKLKPEYQDAVLSYLRAKSSIIAYNKVLSGSARAAEKQLEIEMQQLPVPYVGATVGDKQLTAFQENIDRASDGFPTNLPGLKPPSQIRREVEGGKAAQAPQNEPARPSNVPQGYKWNSNGPKGAGWYK